MFLRPKAQGVLPLGSRLVLIQRNEKLEITNIHSDNQKAGVEELRRTSSFFHTIFIEITL